MSKDECVHGMNQAWCGICTKVEPAPTFHLGEQGFHGGMSKQDLLGEICRALGTPVATVGMGSSLPSHVFEEAAGHAGVPVGSMPEIGEAIARKAGLAWGPDCDSTGSTSGGGSTVTHKGLAVMLDALRRLA